MEWQHHRINDRFRPFRAEHDRAPASTKCFDELASARRPKLDAFTGVIDQILREDQARPKKQRHTAKRIGERLRAEYGFTGGDTIVKAYVRAQRTCSASAS